MKKLLLLLLCVPLIGLGQNVNIPDANFKAYLVGEPSINTNGDSEIQVSEATVFNGTIDCSFLNISDLTGIEAFTALNFLGCFSNNLTNLDVSQNTALTELWCWDNQLTNLDVSQNTALISFRCGVIAGGGGNQLTSLDVSNNTALVYLHCADNQLTNLDVSNNTALVSLHCGQNQLTNLDVSQNTALTDLRCDHNQLTSLDVSANTALRYLYCWNNQLTSLDVSTLDSLNYFNCNNNQLTSLDVSNNTALIILVCGANPLTSLDVSNNITLDRLRCDNNQLTSLDISQNTALTWIWCFSNQLTSLDVSTLDSLTELSCYDNQLTILDVSQHTALTDLNCSSNQLTSLDVSNNINLTSLICLNNQLSTLDLRNGNNLNMETNPNFYFGFNLTNNPNLICINVDDSPWSSNNWTVANGNIDPQHYFSNNCYFGCTDSTAFNYDISAIIDDSSCCYDCGKIQGFVYEDLDSNSIYDSISELPLGNQILELQKSDGSIEYLTTQYDGYYSFFVDTGLQVLSYAAPAYWEISNNITQYSINVLTDSIYSGLDFGILPESTKGDMTVDITTSNYVCGNMYTVWLTVKNLGTETITNVDIDLWLNSAQTTSIQNISNGGVISGLHHVSWNLPGDFYPFIYTGEETSLSVSVQVPAGATIGSLVIDSARVTPNQPNLIEFDITNNYDEETNIVLCSYDPNDKQVFPKKCFYQELDTLDYTIRFQNTGNYPATTVKLVDSLDLEKLDIMSFQVLGASHDYDCSIEVPSVLEVVFDNINLVDSSVSFNESQGFFKYRIIIRDFLPDLQPTATPAFIYFDSNAPVVTNLPEVNFVSNLSASMQSTDISCNGLNDGTATLNIASATAPYTINWNSGDTTSTLTNLSQGTYSVSITDAKNCIYTDSVSIIEPTAIASTSTVSDCNSYTWNGQAYTASGTYSYTTTNVNGCDSTATLNLTINSSTSSLMVKTTCDSYTWLVNNQAYTNSGTYTFVSTNTNGCVHTDSLYLTIKNSTISTTNDIACDSYTWNGQTYTTSGAYSWTGSNVVGCDSTATLNLTVSVIATISQVGLDLEVSVVGGNTPYSYQWNSGETTQAITPLANGDYWVIITDINTCESDSAFFSVNWISTSIEELNINKLSIFPNPSNDVFNIVFNSNTKQDIDLRIHNVIGEVIFSETLTDFSGDYNRTIDMKPYPNAIYILQLSTKDGVSTKKLVLEK